MPIVWGSWAKTFAVMTEHRGGGMRFTKMHGLGNDYVYVNGFDEQVSDPAAVARAVSDRHFGIGSDGLILILPSDRADCRMRMFNADGSEAQMCGNGIRCVAKYVYERDLARHERLSVETLAGVLELELFVVDGEVGKVRVNMGKPRLQRAEIPMRGAPGEVINEPLLIGGATFEVTALSMGNPHCVVFVEDVNNFDVAGWGPLFERHVAFPEGVNTEFIQVHDRETFSHEGLGAWLGRNPGLRHWRFCRGGGVPSHRPHRQMCDRPPAGRAPGTGMAGQRQPGPDDRPGRGSV